MCDSGTITALSWKGEVPLLLRGTVHSLLRTMSCHLFLYFKLCMVAMVDNCLTSSRGLCRASPYLRANGSRKSRWKLLWLVHLFITPLHYSTSTPLHYSTSTPLHYSTSTPLHYSTSTPLHYSTSTPLHYSTSTPLHYSTSTPLHYSTSTPLHYSTSTPLHYSTSTPLHYSTSTPLHYSTSTPLHYSTSTPLHYSTSTPLHYSTSTKVSYLALCPKVFLGFIAGTLTFGQVKVTTFLKSLEYTFKRRKQKFGVWPFDLAISDLLDSVQSQRMTD